MCWWLNKDKRWWESNGRAYQIGKLERRIIYRTKRGALLVLLAIIFLQFTLVMGNKNHSCCNNAINDVFNEPIAISSIESPVNGVLKPCSNFT